ncbi:MAG: LysR family transcriptional regulator [Polyangiaceae bacterium]|nr:LysR family transcriptional regulator [Polyangiaceae bacterium]
MLLDEIEAFVHVVEAGSFTAAAKKLGVPKSTLSRAISRLEDATRVRLLSRSTRTLGLTEPGERFFAQVGPHVGGLKDAMNLLGDAEEEPQGLLRVTMPVDVGEGLLGEIIARFLCRYPKVQVEVDVSARLVNLVEEGFDVAIRASTKLKDSSLIAKKLVATSLQLFAAPTYLARRGTPKTFADLSSHDAVLTSQQGFQALFGKPGSRFPAKARLYAADFSFLRQALRAGAGIGPLPVFIPRGDVASGSLVRVLPEWSKPAGIIYVVYPGQKHVPKKVIAFRDFVADAFSRMRKEIEDA